MSETKDDEHPMQNDETKKGAQEDSVNEIEKFHERNSQGHDTTDEIGEERKTSEEQVEKKDEERCNSPIQPAESPVKEINAVEYDGMKHGYENKMKNCNDSKNPTTETSAVLPDGNKGYVSGGNSTLGEWASLPVLVERLRAVVDLSLAAVNQQSDHGKTTAEQESSLADSQENTRMCTSTERIAFPSSDPSLKNDLKFLEDLLLSDIQTALTHLRQTLEHIDIAALAKYGSASDPTSKLHLLKLVSSLISRLQLPEAKLEKATMEPGNSRLQNRKRRGNRHTVGVSTEELANARKWLEEERERQALINSRRIEVCNTDATNSDDLKINMDKQEGEIRNKYIKDAINQRESLRNKNKETQLMNSINYGGLGQCSRTSCEAFNSSQILEIDRDSPQINIENTLNKINSIAHREHNSSNEEQSRISKLVAALKQQAEVPVSNSQYSNHKKFAKKAKIKRANTVDIPSYLKLQAQALADDSRGCIPLRRPVDVSDKVAINNVITVVPCFEPKTDNDRKFLALLNKNNEAPVSNPASGSFKSFGYTRPVQAISEANKTWNSRFSNIKTTFDKQAPNENDENEILSKMRNSNKLFLPLRVHKDHNVHNVGNEISARIKYNEVSRVNPPITGFHHAPSSLFRKIEKPAALQSPTKVPSIYHWSKENTSATTNMVREKAKAFCERDNNNPQTMIKPRGYRESSGKQKTASPWWSKNNLSESKPNQAITEGGSLDYRSFCKQFAPFLSKTVDPKCPAYREPRQQEIMSQRDHFTVRNSHRDTTDDKISLKILPHNYVQASQLLSDHHSITRENVDDTNYVYGSKMDPYKYGNHQSNTTATLHAYSSVGIQTGVDGGDCDDPRSYCAVPKTTKGRATVCTNACTQTSSDHRIPRHIPIEMQKPEQDLYCYDRHDLNRIENRSSHPEDLDQFSLDHNQSHCIISNGSQCLNGLSISNWDSQDTAKKESSYSTNDLENRHAYEPSYSQHKEPAVKTVSNEEDHALSNIPEIILNHGSAKETDPKSIELVQDSWPFENSNFLNDKYIENQDIGIDVGVVTRYTCAIGTVASDDSPAPLSDKASLAVSQTPSPPPLSRPLSRSRPPTADASTSEDEIRRHNLLQQSLARRLQNDKSSLSDSRSLSPSSTSHTSGYSQPENFNPSPIYHQSSNSYSPNIVESTVLQESLNVNQYPKFLSPTVPRHADLSAYRIPSPTGFQQLPSASSVRRIVALKEAYEQPPTCQVKPIQKERSPIHSALNTVDSSDEYLVSCAAKQSRSIVLSKSESWHQLAISNKTQVNRPSNRSSSSQASSIPKPTRLKSPSSLRTKQFEAPSGADSVKKMEDKIRKYFNTPNEEVESKDVSKSKRFAMRSSNKNLVALSRSRTMLGISGEELRLTVPATQVSLLNVNTADVDKVFDDLFKETISVNDHHC